MESHQCGWTGYVDIDASAQSIMVLPEIAESQARIAELEARNGKLGDAVSYATQKFTHQELRIAQLESALQSILAIPNSEAGQGIMKAFADDALKAKP
jgi:hypothetical protein